MAKVQDKLEAAFTYMSIVKQANEALKFELQSVKSELS